MVILIIAATTKIVAVLMEDFGYAARYEQTQDRLDTLYDLCYLFEKPGGWDQFNPKTAVGWRGSYLMSAGNGMIDTTIHDNLNASARGDDRVLFLKIPDPGANQSCDE